MLTFTEFSGSPYHIGLAMGKAGAVPVHETLTTSPLWENTMQWRGSERVQAMQQLVQHHHPYIWDELHGLARGLELPQEDVFLWNCRGDLPPFTPDDDTQGDDPVNKDTVEETVTDCWAADESTTILTLTAQGPRISHSQDSNAGLANHCGIAEFIIDQGPVFASFVCPGSLPGYTFSVTDKGMAITVNAVRIQNPAIGVPGRVLARTLLNASDLPGAVQLLNDSPRAGGMHLGLAQRGGSALLSIELSATDISIQPVKAAKLHTNHLIHESMQGLPQIITESSRHRLEDGIALLNEADTVEPMRILADQSSGAHPIYRHHTPDASKAARTMAGTELHVCADAVHWDIYEHPDEPVRFRMLDAKHI